MKKNIAIIFGGLSTEHEVSLESATNIFNAFDKNIFIPILLGVDKKGSFFYNTDYLEAEIDLVKNDYFREATECYLLSEKGVVNILCRKSNELLNQFAIAFPIIHGYYGEDGTLQGLLKSLNIRFVGADVLASAVCMDKDITKALLREAGIPVAKSITLTNREVENIAYEKIIKELGIPLFVKPCNAGSSVGVSKVIDKISFELAVSEAFRYDKKILVEEAIAGREVECAILGNENPRHQLLERLLYSAISILTMQNILIPMLLG